MFDTNPNLIQDGPPPAQTSSNSPWVKWPVPLVLIHDGGGTIFSYYLLGEIGRPVWGIANPRFDTNDSWEGGIPAMATQYLKWIKEAVPRGKIIVGGWSLGGLISLEIAKQMAADPYSPHSLLGLIMIDSVCPLVLTESSLSAVQHAVVWGPNTKEETKVKINRCFKEAGKMLMEWTLPSWADVKPKPPPVILLRAKEAVPVPAGSGGVARVDNRRNDPHLGWGEYRKDLVTKVVDIPGHHYNIFEDDKHRVAVTEAIRKVCNELESKAPSGR